jgi:hypothetical protein
VCCAIAGMNTSSPFSRCRAMSSACRFSTPTHTPARARVERGRYLKRCVNGVGGFGERSEVVMGLIPVPVPNLTH